MNRREALKALVAAVAGATVVRPLEAAERIVRLAEQRLAPLGWVSIEGAPEVPFYDCVFDVPVGVWQHIRWRLASRPELYISSQVKSNYSTVDVVNLIRAEVDAQGRVQIHMRADGRFRERERIEMDDLVLADSDTLDWAKKLKVMQRDSADPDVPPATCTIPWSE